MRQFRIEAPQVNCQVIGALYDSDDPSELGQDMLEVVLENGVLIDAGWYPEADPQGSYVISVSRGLDELADARRTDDASEAARIVNELVEAFSGNPVPVVPSQGVSD